MALGRTLPDVPSEDAQRERNAAYKAVRDATTTLTKRGAITVVKAARAGQRQEWILNLNRPMVHENRAPEVHENRAPEVHEKRADWCTENVHPRRTEEDGGLTSGMTKVDLRNGGTGSRQPDASDDQDDSSTTEAGNSGSTCSTCETALDPDGTCFMCVSSTTWRTA
jgi:hypothetical protein